MAAMYFLKNIPVHKYFANQVNKRMGKNNKSELSIRFILFALAKNELLDSVESQRV